MVERGYWQRTIYAPLGFQVFLFLLLKLMDLNEDVCPFSAWFSSSLMECSEFLDYK
jgi:hypothetical protein